MPITNPLHWLRERRRRANVRLTLELREADLRLWDEERLLAHTLWADIVWLTVYKRDNITIDTLCLDITTATGQTIYVTEDVDGWQDLIAQLEARYVLPDGWWERLAQPPFETNYAVLYSRSGDG